LRGRCDIAAAEADPTARASLLRDAEFSARRVERERMGYTLPSALLLRAGVAATTGDRERAIALLRDACPLFDGGDMALCAAASRRCLGKVAGGDEGRALITGAEDWMRAQSIKNPARMTAMLAPGFAKFE
jgi:hypothetical protein